jgi:hypothetical protein
MVVTVIEAEDWHKLAGDVSLHEDMRWDADVEVLRYRHQRRHRKTMSGESSTV